MIKRFSLLCIIMVGVFVSYAQEINRHFFIKKDGLECFLISYQQSNHLTYRFIYNPRDFKPEEIEGRAVMEYVAKDISPYLSTLKDSLWALIPKDYENNNRVFLNIIVNRDGMFRDFKIMVDGQEQPKWLTEDTLSKLYHFFASQSYPRASEKIYNHLLPKESIEFSVDIANILNPPTRK